MPLVIDIETVQDPEGVRAALEQEPEFSAPSNYKDPAKIAATIEAKRQEWRAKVRTRAALSPLTGRVCTVGHWYPDDDGPEAITLEDERDLLSRASMLMEERGLVTFNGADFDLEFLKIRMLVNGVPLPTPLRRGFPRYRYDTGHFDVFRFLAGWGHDARGTLGRWARALRVEPPEAHTAEEIQTAFDAGNFDYLNRICTSDVRATGELYRICIGAPRPMTDEETELEGALEALGE